MEHHTKTEDEIKKAEQYEALKQVLLRLLDDPQVEQKIATLVSRELRQIRRGRRRRSQYGPPRYGSSAAERV